MKFLLQSSFRLIGYLPFFLLVILSLVLIVQVITFLINTTGMFWIAQAIVWETLLYAFTASAISFPIAIWIALYLIEIRKTLFWRIIIRVFRFLSLFPAIAAVPLGLILIFPILNFLNITLHLFSISILFALVMIPIMTDRLYRVFKEFSYMLKESTRSLGMTPIQASFYIFIPALKYKVLSEFLRSLTIVMGDSLLFYFFANHLNTHMSVLSEQILREMILGDSEKFSFMLALFLFLLIGMIEILRAILKRYDES